jgi:hypothetical protein
MTLRDERHALADELAVAFGETVKVYASPPPSIVAPCVIVMPSNSYLTVRRSGCLFDGILRVRLVSAKQDTATAYDDLDNMIEVFLSVVPGAGAGGGIDVGARQYGDGWWICADASAAVTVEVDQNPTYPPGVTRA